MTIDPHASGIPGWAVKMSNDLAELRSGITAIRGSMTRVLNQMDTFVSRREFDARSGRVDSLVRSKLDPLWDDHQRLLGRADELEASSNRFRWVVGIAIGILALIEGATHISSLFPHGP